MLKALSLLSVVLATASVQAQPLVDRLKNLSPKVFDCKPASPATLGDVCTTVGPINASGFEYSERIVFMIPKDLQTPNRVLLHFHGHRGVCESNSITPDKLASGNRLLEQVVAAGMKDSVLIFPVSPGKQTAHNRQLAPKFKEFTEWAEGLLKPTAKKWIVSGHSGAYVPLNAILLSRNADVIKKIDSIGLFDATYGTSIHSGLRNGIKVNPRLAVYSIHVPGSRTASSSLAISRISGFTSRKIVNAPRGQRHCQIPKVQYQEFLKWRSAAQ